jgi:hypothetical protein
VAMCLALRGRSDADVAIMDPWITKEPTQAVVEQLTREGVFRPRIPMRQHANYRFLIDVDGVGNAWSFFEKLLLGCCILKVGSCFEQWFYREVAEWEHFIPVARDFSDLVDKIDWCQLHQAEAKAIGERGQQFALRHTYETAWQLAVDAVKATLVEC